MSLGSFDRTPPPFFRQGPSALTKLVVFAALALFLMVADVRFKVTYPLRAALATVLHPVQRLLLAPVENWESALDYWRSMQAASHADDQARRMLASQAAQVLRVAQLQDENRRLRALLEMRPALQVKSVAAEILYDTPDPFSRKVVIDRGAAQGVIAGSPVINDAGVLGQVTRVYPLSSEVTLLTDRDAAVPVLNTRTQHRSAAFGNGDSSGMELRFLAGNADVQKGDLLNTSGVDGVYPPGLPVAKVVAVERRAESGFAQISLAPVAAADNVRHVLVLDPVGLQMPPRPEPPAPAESGRSANKKGVRAK
jgi:rod shape-determining protein MreC